MQLRNPDRGVHGRTQMNTKAFARKSGYVNTILGRRRHLPDIQSQERFSAAKGHAERAAINTPIQGGAADVAMLAMLQIQNCPKLKALGWTMILQVRVADVWCSLFALGQGQG